MGIAAVAANLAYPLVRRTPRNKRFKAFPTVANGSESQVQIPLGITLESVHFRFRKGVPGAYVDATEAEVKAEVANIRCTFDGIDFIDNSAREIAGWQDFEKAAMAIKSINNGTLCVDLSRPRAQEIQAQDGPAYGTSTGTVGNATISYTLTAASTITLVEATYEETKVTDLGRYLRVYNKLVDLAAGDNVIDTFPFGDPTTLIRGIHLYTTVVDKIGWKADSYQDIEIMDYSMFMSHYIRHGLVPQTGFTHIPFDRRGRPYEGLPVTFQNGELYLHTTGAAAGTRLVMVTEEGRVTPNSAGAQP